MSSTTPQPPSNSGKCVVCGEVTATRCSSCALHGMGWMFFCSRDHQKLVSLKAIDRFSSEYADCSLLISSHSLQQIWKTHKRHCGALSQVWRWPGLKIDEIRLCKRLVHIPLEFYEGRTWGEEAAKHGEPFMVSTGGTLG